MNPLIGVSTQCLYYWIDQSKWPQEQLRIIDVLRKYVSRVELYFSVNDILACDDRLLEEYERRLRGLACSLHLPKMSDDLAVIDTVLLKIEKIVKALSVEYCVLHIDEFVVLKLKNPDIRFALKMGLENSDIRKFGFQHLQDMNMFDTPIILDIDHIEEMKHGSLDTEMKNLHETVLGIHFSTPVNKYFDSFPGIQTTHFPFSRSGNTPPEKLPFHVPVVIEGVFPMNDEEFIAEEVSLIEKKYFNDKG